jgi:hypothetical protein
MKTKKKFQVLSPDGITIEFDKWSYPSKKKMMESFDRWKKQYERQGYYSSTDYGRIPLDELENHCTFREI